MEDTIRIIGAKNPVWCNPEHSIIDVDVRFTHLLEWVPFTAINGTGEAHTQDVWDRVIAGEYGPIADFVPPTPEHVRANMPDLERWRVNTVIDLEPGLREKIDAAIDAMPEPQRTISKNKLTDVQMFRRTDPLFDLIGSDPSIGKTPEDIDAMWQAALVLA